MKKKLILSLFLLFLLSLSLLVLKINSSKFKVQPFNKEPYTVETAKSNGDVILFSGQVINIDKLTRFIENVNINKDDKIRITSFTTEGTPIIQDLVFKNKIIKYSYDNSRDGFASNKDRGIKTDTFSSIYCKKDGEYTTFYFKKIFNKLDFLSIRN